MPSTTPARFEISIPGAALAALAAFAAFAVLGPAAAQKPGEVPKQVPSAAAPRGEALEWTSAAGRPYWYRLPKKKAKGKPALILMLHGTGTSQGWSFWNYPIAKGSWRPDDIVVSPEAVTPGAGKTFNFVQGKADGDQLVQIIKTFNKAFDVGKVYVYGHSQGAFFAYWFAGAHPELVDGIVAHAGNVLGVDHPKLAKEKVAIGILHGKADAVVSVACALRTHRIYKDLGYQKLKLHVVEGLNEQTGHWPLPVQVAGMLDWLDSVSADTAPAATGAALSELARKQPDLGTVADCAGRAVTLLARYKGDDKSVLEERLDAIEALLARAVEQHAAAIEEAGADPKATAFAPWVGHFHVVDAAFLGRDDWRKRMRDLRARAKRDEKRVQRVLQAMGRRWNKSAFKAATAALEKSFVTPAHRDLADGLAPLLKQAIKGVDAAAVAATEKLLATRAEAAKQGAAEAARITATLAAAFVEAHPDW